MADTSAAVYVMNPDEDTIVFGHDLTEGMIVLEEHPTGRDAYGDGEDAELRAQRFFKVTRLTFPTGGLYMNGQGVRFVAEWVDGYQQVKSGWAGNAWLVKKTSVPGYTEPGEEQP